MANDLPLLRSVMASLHQAGLRVLVFGGWAEELWGVIPPGVHRDVDLLVIDPDDASLDGFLRSHREVTEKRYNHKRAFTAAGVLVELFIVRRRGEGYVTCFWGRISWNWPRDLVANVGGLPVASEAALASYREGWRSIQMGRPDEAR